MLISAYQYRPNVVLFAAALLHHGGSTHATQIANPTELNQHVQEQYESDNSRDSLSDSRHDHPNTKHRPVHKIPIQLIFYGDSYKEWLLKRKKGVYREQERLQSILFRELLYKQNQLKKQIENLIKAEDRSAQRRPNRHNIRSPDEEQESRTSEDSTGIKQNLMVFTDLSTALQLYDNRQLIRALTLWNNRPDLYDYAYYIKDGNGEKQFTLAHWGAIAKRLQKTAGAKIMVRIFCNPKKLERHIKNYNPHMVPLFINETTLKLITNWDPEDAEIYNRWEKKGQKQSQKILPLGKVNPQDRQVEQKKVARVLHKYKRFIRKGEQLIPWKPEVADNYLFSKSRYSISYNQTYRLKLMLRDNGPRPPKHRNNPKHKQPVHLGDKRAGHLGDKGSVNLGDKKSGHLGDKRVGHPGGKDSGHLGGRDSSNLGDKGSGNLGDKGPSVQKVLEKNKEQINQNTMWQHNPLFGYSATAALLAFTLYAIYALLEASRKTQEHKKQKEKKPRTKDQCQQ